MPGHFLSGGKWIDSNPDKREFHVTLRIFFSLGIEELVVAKGLTASLILTEFHQSTHYRL